MTGKEIISNGKKVIKIEAEAVSNLEKSIDENFVKAVETIYNSKGRVVLTGVGKSGLVARKIVATLNSTGTAAIYLHPTDALHGDLGMVRKDDVAIIISKSGATEELAKLIPMLKRMEIELIAMSGNKTSAFNRDCDIVLDISVKEEACPLDLAPTSSTTATLAMGDALAVALLEKREFSFENPPLNGKRTGEFRKKIGLKIDEIMIKNEYVPIVAEDAPMKDIIIEMTGKRLGMTCVVDIKGVLSGIITDGDLRRLLEKTMEIKELKAKDILTGDPKVTNKDYLASFALQTMETYKITSLVVVDAKKKPEGIVHLHDLLNLGLQSR